MKTLSLILTLLFGLNGFAQSFLEAYEATRHFEPFDNLNGTYDAEFQTLTGNPEEWSKIMGVFYEFDDIRFGKRGFEGSAFLFDSWDNRAEIIAGNKKYIISNINFHINRDIFVTQMEGDSTFVYDFKGIDRIVVNNRAFKNVYTISEGKNKVYEVIFENKQMSLLKGYSTDLVQASPNPMVNRTRNKIKRVSNYYILKDGNLRVIKLKKSNILRIFDEDQAKLLEQFVKENKLSYRKEEDVTKMLKYLK